jgi:hypothetical protein
VDDLPLEVRLVDGVVVDDAERADAGSGEVERRGGAEAAGADQEDARLEEPQLAFLADFGDEEMPAVAPPLGLVERLGDLEGQAVSLPVGEAAGEGDHVLVAELLERLGGERRAVSARAIEEDGGVLIRSGVLDARFEVPAGDMHGAREVTLVPLVALADVDHLRGSIVDQLTRARGVDFVDLALDLLEKLAIAQHGVASPNIATWKRASEARG